MSRLSAPRSTEPAQLGNWLRKLAEQVETLSLIDVEGFGAAVPATTALRWIGQLEARGLVHRVAVPSDRRSSHLILAAGTREALLQWAQRHLVAHAPAEA